MGNTIKLTARQQQVLDFIQHAIAASGAPPTRAEIAAALGFRSANAAEDHLQALARKGAIELVSGTSRGIRLRHVPDNSTMPSSNTNSITLPLIGRVAAGSPILAQEHVDTNYNVAADLFSSRPDYLLKVRGMSMRDVGILDGDLLAVRATQNVHSGQIVVARLGTEVTVKRLQLLADHIELQAENPDYSSIIVKADEPFAIEGLAVGLIRNGELR